LIERAKKHNIFPELERILQRPDEYGRGGEAVDDSDDDYVAVQGTEKGAERKVIRLDLTGPGSVSMEYLDACRICDEYVDSHAGSRSLVLYYSMFSFIYGKRESLACARSTCYSC
jgi:hypothetical protein